MALYRIEEYGAVHVTWYYDVEADSPEQALERVQQGDSDGPFYSERGDSVDGWETQWDVGES